MPLTQLVPSSPRLYDQITYYPDIRTTVQTGTAFQTTGYTNSGISTTLWSAAAGGGASTHELKHNVPCVRFASSGAGANRTANMGNNGTFVALTQANIRAIAGGSPVQSAMRVQRISFLLSQGNLPLRGGVGFHLGAPLSPTLGGYCFVVEGDGAGGWQWRTNKTAVAGASTETVPIVTVPVLVGTNWTQFAFEVVSARPGVGDGYVALYVNNIVFLTRTFGAGTVLPVYADSAGSIRFMFTIYTNDGSAGSLIANAQVEVAGIEFYVGRFLADGTEIQGP